MLRAIRWYFAKLRLTRTGYPPPHVRIAWLPHQARLEDFPVNTTGYERLAAIWEEYASWFVPNYPRFLAAAAAIHRYPIESALDLACGTGLLSRQLASYVPTVVGLDASPAMLREASCRSAGMHIRFVEGDFRRFSLDQSFHAVVCATDSLNYLQKKEELLEVFRCVARHLLPGGFFVFDAYDRTFFEMRKNIKLAVVMGDERFETYLFYDPESRIGETRLVFPNAVENHRRIPIDAEDVCWAAQELGLNVVECFSCRTFLRSIPPPVRHFYVLRKCAA